MSQNLCRPFSGMITDKLQIRDALATDEKVLFQMICGLENKELDEMAFHEVFQINLRAQNITYFLAEVGGIPVGMASCHVQPLIHHAGLVAEIQEMFVYDAFRSQEIGKALMRTVVLFAKNKGALQLEVTSRGTRRQAHRFYEREGFEKSHVKLVKYLRLEP